MSSEVESVCSGGEGGRAIGRAAMASGSDSVVVESERSTSIAGEALWVGEVSMDDGVCKGMGLG